MPANPTRAEEPRERLTYNVSPYLRPEFLLTLRSYRRWKSYRRFGPQGHIRARVGATRASHSEKPQSAPEIRCSVRKHRQRPATPLGERKYSPLATRATTLSSKKLEDDWRATQQDGQWPGRLDGQWPIRHLGQPTVIRSAGSASRGREGWGRKGGG